MQTTDPNEIDPWLVYVLFVFLIAICLFPYQPIAQIAWLGAHGLKGVCARFITRQIPFWQIFLLTAFPETQTHR